MLHATNPLLHPKCHNWLHPIPIQATIVTVTAECSLLPIQYWVSVRGVHAPCFLHNYLPPCSLLLSILCPLLLFDLFPCSFFILPCSLLFLIFSCSGIFFLLHAPFQNFPLLHAPFYHFWCSLLQDYHLSDPSSFTYFMACFLGLAPCSRLTPNRGSVFHPYPVQATIPCYSHLNPFRLLF